MSKATYILREITERITELENRMDCFDDALEGIEESITSIRRHLPIEDNDSYSPHDDF